MIKRTTFARNRQGVKVKKCCASCQHKCIGTDGSRLCALTMKMVSPNFRCKKWSMVEGLQNAGLGEGSVKSKEYLEFVRETRMQEQAFVESGKMELKQCQSNNALREQFEELFGKSPFEAEL